VSRARVGAPGTAAVRVRERLLEEPEVRAHLSADALDALMDLRGCIGTAELQVDDTVQMLLARNAEDRRRYPVETP
jgi:hypothetical protein